jgi:hypothetical protein
MDIPQGVTYHQEYRAVVCPGLPDSGGQPGGPEYLEPMGTGMSNLRHREPALACGAMRA